MPIKANAEIETMAAQLAAMRGQSTEEVVALACLRRVWRR
jgi:hypothetical protein